MGLLMVELPRRVETPRMGILMAKIPGIVKTPRLVF